MENESIPPIPEGAECRSCRGPLSGCKTKEGLLLVRCRHCGDTYWIDPQSGEVAQSPK